MTLETNRRDLLKTGGSLAIAFSLVGPSFAEDAATPGKPVLPGDLKTYPKLSSWLRLEADGKVRLLVGKVELGQGILTAYAQLAADELDVDIKRIVITSGDTRIVPDEGVTAGSMSMSYGGVAVQQAAAELRQHLLGLAATKFGADAGALKVADGAIAGPNGARTTYWDLISGDTAELEATGLAKQKGAAARRYIGKPVPRIDIPAKATGALIYIQDLRPEGMLHGRIVRPPSYTARLVSIEGDVSSMPGVVKVVRDGSFLGVIAQREEQAIDAAEALRRAARWTKPQDGPTQDSVYDWLKTQPAKDIVIKDTTNPATAANTAATIEAEFRRPYHMHATIGPSTAIATLGDDGVMLIQTHSQSVFETAAAIADMLGVPPAKVQCEHKQGAGCYGHNGADDVAADAALLARAMPGRPVRIQWSRHDEHKWEPYGSAMVMRLKAAVDAKGDVLDWDYTIWSTSHGTRPGKKAGNLLAGQMLEKPFALPTPVNGGAPNYAADRNGIPLYEFPGQHVRTHFVTNFAARASSTRGLGAYANVFSIESFIDDLARGAKADPVEYRLRYLKDPRGRDVLTKTAEMFGWANWKAAPGRGRGIGFARYKNLATYTAVAMEVEVDRASGAIRVLRVSSASDAGDIVSHDGVRNQIEGGIIQSMSWTLKEGVRFDPNGVRSEDWVSYPILTFSEIPPIDIALIERPGAPFLGAGEASQGPTGAALANAVRDATGVRFHETPFIPSRIKAGLQA
ncbi:MAG: aldehyde dehydrogenase [Hyphomicrobiales bacterium]|nr:aldehyde dehydrogenase [Hyphomicrobiales bacterium]